MVSYADMEKLRGVRAQEPIVLSLFLPVPLDPVGVRGLAARAGNLLDSVRAPAGAGRERANRADRAAVLDAVTAHSRDWLGHTVAFFASETHGLFEVLPLPGAAPERAVLATRPYVRPVLAALQWYPDYLVAVVDRRRAWLLSVGDSGVDTVLRRSDDGPRSPGFGGWYGLESYRVQQRISELSERHYRHVAAALERATALDRNVPLVIGGHHDSINPLLQALPPAAREAFAGSFAADPHTLTPAAIRELTRPLVDGYVTRREQELVAAISGEAPGRLAALGLPACLAALDQGAVSHLLVARQDMSPGFACGTCGALSTASGQCPDGGPVARAVPDLLEEMTQLTLDGDGRVTMLHDAPFSAAAKLRFPVTKGGDQA